MAILYNVNGNIILFIHIPKTGGGTLHRILNKYRIVDSDIVGHLTYEEVFLIKGAEFMKKVDYVLTIIRNPYDRCLSFYNFIKKYDGYRHGFVNEKNIFSKLSFEKHVELFDNFTFTPSIYHTKSTSSPYLYTKQQSEYILYTPPHKLRIIKLESFKQDFNLLFSDLGVDVTHIDFDTKTRQSTYTNNVMGCYNNDALEIVNRYFELDFDKFGYKLIKCV